MTTRIWKNYYDIVILPSKGATEYSISLSKKYAKYGATWTLGKKAFIPHISLYHIPVKTKDFDSFVECIKTIANTFHPGYLHTTAVKSRLLLFDKPKWIQKEYLKVMKGTVKFYDWEYGTDKLWSLPSFPKKMHKIGARFMKKYGTPIAGANFAPHITLTGFETNKEKLKSYKAKPFKFKPTHIYICGLGPSHSCQRIITKIRIGGK